MNNPYKEFGVIGGGAWGTALALSMQRAGRATRLWVRSEATAAIINQSHENKLRLPGVMLDPSIHAVTKLTDLEPCDVLIMAMPTQKVRGMASELKLILGSRAIPIVVAAKGLEETTSFFLSDIIKQELPVCPFAVLSGPSFASEVGQGLPTALTLATEYESLGKELMAGMASSCLRLYLTDDVRGAQLGGAVKNVLAIATGIVAGRKMGESARAALLTRGVAELTRLGLACGARPETLMGLSGLGDLVLTCTSPLSRNMTLGYALGEGKSLHEILASRTTVAEGVTTAAAALALAKARGVDMPIVASVDAILNHGADISKIITQFMTRPLKVEAQ